VYCVRFYKNCHKSGCNYLIHWELDYWNTVFVLLCKDTADFTCDIKIEQQLQCSNHLHHHPEPWLQSNRYKTFLRQPTPPYSVPLNLLPEHNQGSCTATRQLSDPTTLSEPGKPSNRTLRPSSPIFICRPPSPVGRPLECHREVTGRLH
jgi:hypothetical protein